MWYSLSSSGHAIMQKHVGYACSHVTLVCMSYDVSMQPHGWIINIEQLQLWIAECAGVLCFEACWLQKGNSGDTAQ